MSMIKRATLLPLHTFITIILNYSVVMFWSSSSLLLGISTPGSTSFVQSSNCPFTGSLQCCSTSCLNFNCFNILGRCLHSYCRLWKRSATACWSVSRHLCKQLNSISQETKMQHFLFGVCRKEYLTYMDNEVNWPLKTWLAFKHELQTVPCRLVTVYIISCVSVYLDIVD